MKRLFFLLPLALTLLASSANASERPDSVCVTKQPGHVQGIAYDKETGNMYMSFTTNFLVVDHAGNVVASVDRIHGHLGAMTFDPDARKVYASLECKDDEIGAPISNRLGEAHYTQSAFYVAEIDVDKIDRLNVPMADVMKRHEIVPANVDYNAEVEVDGRTLKHRYGCSGIDGVTVAPGFGGDDARYLYVAYGIYSDTTRVDNDYQILLQYNMNDFSKPVRRIFVKTGNTSYGVQNLAYDSYSGKMIMAVYKGKKSRYHNYTHFALDMSSTLKKSRLENVPYQKSGVWMVNVSGAWDYKFGSMGLCPLGDGFWYVAEPSKMKGSDGKKYNGCNARLCRLFDYFD